MDKTNYDNKSLDICQTPERSYTSHRETTQPETGRPTQERPPLQASILQTTFIISHLPNPVRTIQDPQATIPLRPIVSTTSSYYTTTTRRSVMSSRHQLQTLHQENQQTSWSASTSSPSSPTFLSPKPATSSRLYYNKTPHLTQEQPYLQNKSTTCFLHASTKHHSSGETGTTNNFNEQPWDHHHYHPS